MRENGPPNLPNARCGTSDGYPGFRSLFFLTLDRVVGASGENKRVLEELIGRAADARRKIQAAARCLGYDRRCTEAIPTCGGECCRWHFPRRLSAADMAIMIWGAPDREIDRLAASVAAMEAGVEAVSCPLRTRRGCRLPFDRRPLICASAYPCFAGESYHRLTSETIGDLQPVLFSIGEHIV